MTGKMYYNKEHLWVRVEGNEGTIGITNHAQEELGDILLVETSEQGVEIKQSASFGQVESAKAVSDLISPVSGTIIEVNESLEDEPELMNEDPLGKGWVIKITLKDPKELDDLMGEDTYNQYLQEELD